MRRYETIFIADADLPDDSIDELVERFGKIITDMKGIVVKIDKWGKRKLAYQIKKQQRGYYILMDFVGERTVVAELERNMKFHEKVLKYMSVKKADKVDLEEIEKEIAAASKDETAEATTDETTEEITSTETVVVPDTDTVDDADDRENSEESSEKPLEEKESKE